MSDLRVGIVGLGWVAGAHIETFKKVEGAAVTAVCSRRELDEGALAAQFGLPLRAYNDYEAMLADPEIDIVSICTPHPLHPRQTILAARAGKHVLIEKPVAITYEDTLEMRRVLRETGVRSCVCFECRFSKQFQMSRAMLDQGLLGRVHYAEVDYYHGIGPWYKQFEWNVKKDVAGSSLLSAGCHAMDILLYLMDAPVAEVSCYATHSANPDMAAYEYPSTSVTILRFEDGRIGKVASSVDCYQPYYFHTHLVGSEGSLLDNRFYSQRLGGLLKDGWSELHTDLVDSGEVSEHPYEPQFRAFVNSIRAGGPMPLTDFEDAFETHRVCFAADRSAEDGRPVKMEEFEA